MHVDHRGHGPVIRKLALRVCPVPGCAKIGGSDCPEHRRSMIREVYVHEVPNPERDKLRKQVDGLSDSRLRATFERVGKDLGIL